MKKLFVLALLVVSQISFAAPAREVVRRMTIEQARERVTRDIERLRAQGKDVMNDTALRGRVITSTSRRVVTLAGDQHTNLSKLASISTVEVLSELTRLSSIASDPSSTAKQKAMAAKSLQLMALAGTGVSTLISSSPTAAQRTSVAKIIEVSRKISSLDFGTASDAFVAKYERALREGKTVDQAVRIASNNKFGVRELRECE